MGKTFRSNGKLLLTGEYFVLDGADALALPTQKGQLMVIHPNDTKLLEWRSFDAQNKIWFEGTFGLNFKMVISSDKKTADTLINVLKECMKMNPLFNPFGKTVETFLEFPNNWGLGSSSTFINNLAQWAQVNPFELLWKSFGGSGYDIASAFYNQHILYSVKNNKPLIKEVSFTPVFQNQLYFIHLNQKQNSKEGIIHYKSLATNKVKIIPKLNNITEKILESKTLKEFENQLEEHENIISKALNIKRIQNQLFSDYKGIVKSLGAWGGDFVLVTFREGMHEYLNQKGYKTIIPFNEMVK
ncbi:MAG: GYDIA family GHMP kinase [Flavobacteriales bacterium]